MAKNERPLAPISSLDALLKPTSIAIIGASKDLSKWGGKTLKHLREFGYQGQIYPVNPKYDTILGLKCYPSPRELPPAVDLAIIALPAKFVLPTLADLAEVQAKSAMVLSSGFAELNADGIQKQKELSQLALQNNIRVIGPNCLGIINVTNRITASPSSALALGTLIYEPIGLISQSGAIGLASLLNRASDRNVGFSVLLATGNEADLETADFLAYLAKEPHTRVITIYSEGFHDGRRFLLALDKAIAAEKPVILLKAGRSKVGQQSAASHTAMIATRPAVMQGISRQKGVIEARDLDDIFEKAMLFARCPSFIGRRVGIVTTSGGIASILGDLCSDYNLEVPSLTPDIEVALRGALPSFNPVNNPLDISGQFAGDNDLIWTCLSQFLEDPNTDLVILALTTRDYGPLAEKLNALPLSSKPIVILATGGSLAEEGIRMLESSQHFPIFSRADKCVEGVRDLIGYSEFLRKTRRSVSAPDKSVAQPDVPAIVEWLSTSKSKILSEHESKKLLSRYDIAVTTEGVVRSLTEAIAVAKDIGYPLALKIHAQGLAHKTELGGVVLDITNDDELAFAYHSLMERIQHHNPDLEINELLVQEMVKGGLEVIAGVSYDQLFGPIITFGPGGILVHLLSGHVCRACPLSPIDARDMVKETGLLPLIQGYRGSVELDLESVIQTLVNLASLAVDLQGEIEEVDLNPIIVQPKGRGAIVVDALVASGGNDDRSLAP